jgi:hypothetical protein
MIYYEPQASEMLAQRGWMPQAYVVICLANGKVYNGIVKNEGKTWLRRTERELSQLGTPNEHFRRAIQKYGRAKFHCYLFAVADTVEEICEVERQQILETRSYLREYGYNKTMGGEGVVLTPEMKAKQDIIYASDGWKAKQLAGTRRGHTEEWRSKLIKNAWKLRGKGAAAMHEIRIAQRPDWVTENGIESLLSAIFPKKETSPTQVESAARWRQFIQLFFQDDLTFSQTAERMCITQSVAKGLLNRIHRASKGLRCDGRGRRGARPRGRPKKLVP